MNLGHLLDQAFLRYAGRIAAADAIRSLTFEEMDNRSLRLGNALEGKGVSKGNRLASLQYNSLEALEIDVASARFGFVRTFLNARSDLDSFVYILNDCGAKVLFYGHEFSDKIDKIRGRLPQIELYICIGGTGAKDLDYDDFVRGAEPRRVAYDVASSDWHSIFYTSGSTGNPKGVVLDQRNWLVLVRNQLIDLFMGATSSDVVLHAAPISHGSGSFVYAHWVRGGRQQILPRFDAEVVLDTIERERVTTMFLAPTMIIKLLDADAKKKRDLSSLHSAVYGGAPMAAEQVAMAMRRWGPVFAQLYGLWEAPQFFTAMSQKQHIEALESGAVHRLASAGTPITFGKVGILDADGRLLPFGEEGEVVTAGDHLMVGYLNRQQDTDAIRVGEWQRTGDIGRLEEDGFLYLVDRKNDVIVTGGTNVYPREIEEVLYRHPAIHEVVAVGVPDNTWGETVHAVVVPREHQSIDPDGFLAWCREHLPADKRPRSCELMTELPKSAYGKIERRAMRARYWEGRGRQI